MFYGTATSKNICLAIKIMFKRLWEYMYMYFTIITLKRLYSNIKNVYDVCIK